MICDARIADGKTILRSQWAALDGPFAPARPITLNGPQGGRTPTRSEPRESALAQLTHRTVVTIWAAMAVGLVALLTASCGVGRASRQSAHPTVKTHSESVVLGPGRLVSIGDGRSLYLLCRGSGSPTVILEAGFGGASDSWSEVQPALARTTRTCAYDPAGFGYSPPIPGVHDAADEIADLARLLDRAGIRPPYALVGHSSAVCSSGCSRTRTRSRRRASSWSTRWATPRTGACWESGSLSRRACGDRSRGPLRIPSTAGVNILAGEDLDAKVRSLGDVPLIVITRGRLEENGSGTLFPAPIRRSAAQLWLTMQDELAALSPDSIHLIALRSGHFIPFSSGGQPDVVIAAALAVIQAARTHTRLEPCPRLFHSTGVKCRT